MSLQTTAAEPFEALVARFTHDPDDPPHVTRVSLSGALRSGNDPLDLLAYLAGVGIAAIELDDLLRVNGVADEDEISAHPVAEGVALCIASDGSWVLFTP